MKMGNGYYLGLDMGTSSVGWAVTDQQYNLLRLKGKDLWGVRLFKEAETAELRRAARVSRRRRQREVARIGLLRELFADEINKIDPAFFHRLEESKYHKEDKQADDKYGLFSDKIFTDKEYFQKYPTIFHLRKELLEDTEAHDIRLVYLAILNIFKHRGHFLNASLEAETNGSFEGTYETLSTLLAERLGIGILGPVKATDLEAMLSGKGLSRSKAAEKTAEAFGIRKTKEKRAYEVIKALCGLAFNLEIIFDQDFADGEQKKPTLSFRDSEYSEKAVLFKELIGEDDSEILDLMKSLHDQALLSSIMGGNRFLSQARVASYNKHKEDLSILKKVMRELVPDQYDMMFRSDGEGSYSAYVGSFNSDHKQRRSFKKGKAEDLYATIKKILKEVPEDNHEAAYILNEIEKESFLPKQLTGANGVIPNQVHLSELQMILKNAQKYLLFLGMPDENGITTADKIAQLFKFQIPYYVGPLNGYHKDKGGNAWVVRKQKGAVLPWNFDEMIDSKQSSEEFIERLIRKCTYIKNQPVLPKSSLLYEKYMVLNELNNLKIRGLKIDPLLKQDIYNDLFLSGKKVTQKKLSYYLIAKGILGPDEADALSGVDGDFASSLGSYGKFASMLGDVVTREDVQAMIERIIFWGTVYGHDKRYFKENITEHYSEVLTEAQIKRISGFKFNDWGKLSREFLEMSGVNKETGEELPLIQMLWSYNDNLMELQSDRFTFAEQIKEEYGSIIKTLTELEHSDLDDLYLSSPVKRMVWQTVLIVKELEKALGEPPKRIFVEMARESGEKGKRTTSRKQKLISLYKNCKNETRDWVGELNERTDSELRGKKLYLYYMQLGKCMYTGETIDIGQLFDDNLYDIDHIYPRRVVKDDSLENNLVLVNKRANAHKSDLYPIEEKIYKNQHNFWKTLLSNDMKDGFITREKYNRLINRNPLTDEQLAGFISRQLVETRQGTKVITQILEQTFDKSEVIFVKAGNISDFRHDFDLLKARSLNDFHHAQDAYLSIAVGNAYYVKFTKNPMNFIKERKNKEGDNAYHMNKIFNNTIKRKEEMAWVAGNPSDGTSSISIVKKQMQKNTPMISKMTHEGHGELFNATLYSSSKAVADTYIPLKSKDERIQDVTKYGGYTSVSTANFFLVEHEAKGKRIRTLEALPLIYKESIGDNVEKLNQYCCEQLDYKEPDIRLPKIKLQSLIRRDGFYLNITGKTLNRISVANGVPMILDNKWGAYIKKIEKTLDAQYVDGAISKDKNFELYEELVNKHLNSIYSKRPNPIGGTLKNGKDLFNALDLKDQCYVLSQIMQISQLGNYKADLLKIGGKEKSGAAKIHQNISGAGEFVLVNQSITGLYRNEIDLLTV